MNRIDIRLHTAPLTDLQGCEDSLNEWANRRIGDGYRIRDMDVRLTDTTVVILAIADMSAAQDCATAPSLTPKTDYPVDEPQADEKTADENEHTPEEANTTQDSDRDPDEDPRPLAAARDPLDALFYHPGHEPPPAVKHAGGQRPAHPLFEQSLFNHSPEQPRQHATQPPEPSNESPNGHWQLSQRSNTWWRPYHTTGTGQVGPKGRGEPGFWWRIIGPGGKAIAKGDADTADLGKQYCDRHMKEPAPA